MYQTSDADHDEGIRHNDTDALMFDEHDTPPEQRTRQGLALLVSNLIWILLSPSCFANNHYCIIRAVIRLTRLTSVRLYGLFGWIFAD